MEKQQILNKVKDLKKGAYVSLVKTKDLGAGVLKITNMVIRLGVEYSHMKANLNKVCGSLPWGNWLTNYEGLVIEHKGQLYLRVANSYTQNSSSEYYYNGSKVSKEFVISLIGEKKLASKPSDVYCIKFDNIIKIG